jgi:hypothetical protein
VVIFPPIEKATLSEKKKDISFEKKLFVSLPRAQFFSSSFFLSEKVLLESKPKEKKRL